MEDNNPSNNQSLPNNGGSASSESNTKGLIVAGVAILVLAIVIGYYTLGDQLGNQIVNRNTSFTSHERLVTSNEEYRTAEEFRSAGNHAEAVAYYEEAMSKSNSADAGQIDYKIGSSLLADGKISSGVSHLKEVASNTNYNGYVRAYAINEMATFYFHDFNEEITSEIFKDAPYSSMFISNNIKASYNNLYKYSVSIQPTAQAELRIARYLAEELISNNDTASIDREKTVLEIRDRIVSANKDLERIVSKDRNSASVTFFLLGQVLSMLERLGASAGISPESAFDSALTYANEKKDPLNYIPPISYSYAIHLATVSQNKDAEKILRLMKNVYEYPQFNKSSLYKRLLQYKDSPNSIDYQNAVAISKMDTGFKNFLVSIGWKL